MVYTSELHDTPRYPVDIRDVYFGGTMFSRNSNATTALLPIIFINVLICMTRLCKETCILTILHLCVCIHIHNMFIILLIIMWIMDIDMMHIRFVLLVMESGIRMLDSFCTTIFGKKNNNNVDYD